MPPVSTDTITVICPCGKKLKAPASAAGKKAKCPSCGNVMKLDAPAGAAGAAPAVPPVPTEALAAAKAANSAGAVTAKKVAAPPPPPAPADHADDGGDDLGDLYALAAVEKQARSAGAVDDSPRCPKCFTELPSGAVLCTNCGFDLRTRKALSTTRGDAAPPALKPLGGGVLNYGAGKAGKKDKMAPQGSFLVGLACCAGFAAAGSIVWFLIGYFTGYSFGFIAMGVGALAGVGMQIGQKGYSKLGGLVASALTLLAIILANIALFVAVLAHPPGQTKQSAKLEDQEKKLTAEEKGYDPRVLEQFQEEYRKAHPSASAKADTSADSSSDEGDDDASANRYLRRDIDERQAAVDKVKAMPKPDYDATVAKLDEQEERNELIEHLTQEELSRRNVSIHQSSYEDHYNSAHDLSKKQVDGMTRDQVKAALGPRQEKAKAEAQQRMQNFEKDLKDKGLGDDAKGAAVRTGVFLIILLLIFGWKTIFFVILAMFFAYRTASGGVSG
jgi:hypothetical protein